MKPATFVYEAPATLDEALALMAEHGDLARVLAGGQSLVPAMNMRAARPHLIVDINRIPDLDGLRRDNGVLRVGPLVRHRQFESPPVEGAAGRLISETAHLVAHPPIRTRGTMLGSLAFADPAAEWCAVTQLFDCEVTAASTRGERSLPVGELLTGAFTNSLTPDEILVEARLTIPKAVRGAAIAELSHTRGDFAVVLAAALLIEEDGLRHRIVVGGAAPTGRRLRRLEEELDRDARIAQDVESIGELISDELDPPPDAYGSSGYRARLAAVLIARALKEATS